MFTVLTLIAHEIAALKAAKVAPFQERTRNEQVKRLEALYDQLCLEC